MFGGFHKPCEQTFTMDSDQVATKIDHNERGMHDKRWILQHENCKTPLPHLKHWIQAPTP